MKLKMLALMFAVPVLLSGCGGDSESKKTDSQVAVKVNGEEVTVHQLNQLLTKVRVRVTEDNQQEIKQKTLESLVDQTLVLQAAKQAKLDRTPEVLSALEAAKRKVLVDAYVQRTLQGVGKPTSNEVEEFYNSRPEIFANRKLFVYSQVTIPSEKEKLDGLVESVKQVATLEELTAMLSKDKVEYREVLDAKTSEKLPKPLLAPLNSIKVGDIGYLKMSDGLLVVSVLQAVPQPVSLDQAKVAIERQLFTQKQKEAAEKLVSSLKESALIEYVGDFKPSQD
ncbi:MAG: EpsD family peptidyl-prolyl cis-trans isomerase [Pseudomonadota bacterium]|nr:EpsD family peptidyl-prolyl cis-trans isomerase [Pseudomonadota bacterium]